MVTEQATARKLCMARLQISASEAKAIRIHTTTKTTANQYSTHKESLRGQGHAWHDDRDPKK